MAREVGDDHFHDFVWERGRRWRWGRGRGRRRGWSLGWTGVGWASRFVPGRGLGGLDTEETIDLGFTSAPNGRHANKEVYPYHAWAA